MDIAQELLARHCSLRDTGKCASNEACWLAADDRTGQHSAFPSKLLCISQLHFCIMVKGGVGLGADLELRCDARVPHNVPGMRLQTFVLPILKVHRVFSICF